MTKKAKHKAEKSKEDRDRDKDDRMTRETTIAIGPYRTIKNTRNRI